MKLFSEDFTNWLWLEVNPLYILLQATSIFLWWFLKDGVWTLSLSFSSKSEDWNRFWGHVDGLIHFSGQIHFIAYVLGKSASCDGSAFSQPRSLQTHLPIQIWFAQRIEAWRIRCSKKRLKMGNCHLWFSCSQNIIFLFSSLFLQGKGQCSVWGRFHQRTHKDRQLSRKNGILGKVCVYRLQAPHVNTASCTMVLTACHLMHSSTNMSSIFYAHMAIILWNKSRTSDGKWK